MGMNPFDLAGHVAVVTGGNSGIGLGIARGLLDAGARVMIWGRDPQKNEAAVRTLDRQGAVASLSIDVCDEEGVIAGVRETAQRFGRIDSCFANAGFGEARPFLETRIADWDRIIDGNLTGTFLTFREVAKHMVARGGGGKLIALSSIGGVHHGMPQQAPYSVTKAGVCALVRSVAVELARYDIQANALSPGWIDTPATAQAMANETLSRVIVQRTPARRWGAPADLAGTAVFLASQASQFMTGETLTVDGGYTKF